MTDIHVGCGYITNTIYAGKVRKYKDGHLEWSGKRSDVTNECLHAVVTYMIAEQERQEKLDPSQRTVKVYTNGRTGKKYILQVKEVGPDDYGEVIE